MTKCILCKEPFTNKNVYSALGWREVEISGMCELCFDEVTREPEEVDDQMEFNLEGK